MKRQTLASDDGDDDMADDCEPILLAGVRFTISGDGTVDRENAWGCTSQHDAGPYMLAPIHALSDCWKYRKKTTLGEQP